jgi:hypothetical protein
MSASEKSALMGSEQQTVFNDPQLEDASEKDTPAEAPPFSFPLLLGFLAQQFKSQLQLLVPIFAILSLFQLIALHTPLKGAGNIIGGFFAVATGLTMFLTALRGTIMPLGKALGEIMPTKFSVNKSLSITFVLGFICTMSEPAVEALKMSGKLVKRARAPYLVSCGVGVHFVPFSCRGQPISNCFIHLVFQWYVLNDDVMGTVFVAVIGTGVALASFVGSMRLLRGWGVKPLISISLLITLALSAMNLAVGGEELLGLAWDVGAVATGLVTCPLVLGLGVGLSNAQPGKAANKLDGFGIVTLATLYPICTVLIMSMCIVQIEFKHDEEKANITDIQDQLVEPGEKINQSPWIELIYAMRAVIPLTGFLCTVIKYGLGEEIPQGVLRLDAAEEEDGGQKKGEGDAEEGKQKAKTDKGPSTAFSLPVIAGVLFAMGGMVLFTIGLKYGLDALAEDIGAIIPAGECMRECIRVYEISSSYLPVSGRLYRSLKLKSEPCSASVVIVVQ